MVSLNSFLNYFNIPYSFQCYFTAIKAINFLHLNNSFKSFRYSKNLDGGYGGQVEGIEDIMKFRQGNSWI